VTIAWNELMSVPQRQLGQRLHVAVGRQRHHLEQVRIAADQIERARAHGARRAENGDALARNRRRPA
jgi:hypothetical protein